MASEPVVAGGVYRRPPASGHAPWVVRVTRVSVTSIEVTVIRGQTRGKSKRFRIIREQFERSFSPASGGQS